MKQPTKLPDVWPFPTNQREARRDGRSDRLGIGVLASMAGNVAMCQKAGNKAERKATRQLA